MGKSSRTTFILGAGASRHAGYPFVKSMGKELLGWMRLPRESTYCDFAQLADFLEEQFGSDIEDLFNGIQAEIDDQRPGYSLFATIYKPCLVEAMRQWFADIQRQNPGLSYEKFALEIVKPGDQIITFNYDISLDAKMRESGKWSVGDGYGFTAQGLPMKSTVKIFKLHGSINWLAVLFEGRISGPFALPLQAPWELGQPLTIET